MAFQLKVATFGGTQLSIELAVGETLFVLGANGTGKSSLLQRLASSVESKARRISAHRQTWFESSALQFSPSQAQIYDQQAKNWDNHVNSRWMEQNAQIRSGLTLYDLIDAENVDARAIATAMRAENLELATALSRKAAPLAKINELLSLSNIDVQISVHDGDHLMASKNGCDPYGVAELSDGERNALLIAADVLTAKPNTLLVIDEPERHLHRSIISPLLTQLFRYREDCSFVVGTHDLMLPIDNVDARVILVRSCTYEGIHPKEWDVDLISAGAEVDEDVKHDIIGSRRKIVFVEGEASSLDRPLYGVLFPGISVRAKGSSRDVERAVCGIRDSKDLHWVKSWGIIDNDGRDPTSIASLQSEGIFALPFYSVESIYYHPKIIFAVAGRQAAVTGEDGDANAENAIRAAISAVQVQLPRLAARAVEKTIRRIILSSMPTLRQIEEKRTIEVQIDTGAIIDGEMAALSTAAQLGDWIRILTRCPIRETPALDAIARAVGLQNRHRYEAAVLQMLKEDDATLDVARSMFGSLLTEMQTD